MTNQKQSTRDEVLKRMLKMPPKLHKAGEPEKRGKSKTGAASKNRKKVAP